MKKILDIVDGISSSKGKKPLVSVVLPIYNGSEFLVEAIQSILNQSFTNFEVIAIDDGSTDDSIEIIKQFHDPKIRLHCQRNIGLAETLNRGIDLSIGKFIARQDQDDISYPDRLLRQVDFLENHPDCAMVGTWAEIWEGDRKTDRLHANPSDDSTLKFELLFDNPFVHSSVMLRRGILKRVGGYRNDPNNLPPEDYDLWSRIARKYKIANIPEVLHVYREVPQSMSRDGISPFLLRVMQISSENIAWAAGLSVADPHVQNIPALIHKANEKVIAPPDFFAMQKILHRTMANIFSSEEHQKYFEIAKERLMTSTAIYWKHFGFSLHGILFRYWRYGQIVLQHCKILMRDYFGNS